MPTSRADRRVADDAAPLLPELARSLRTLGRPNDAATEAAHAAVFVPLLDARARAALGDAGDALDALRGAALSARIGSLARTAAERGQADPARARARAAATHDLLDGLRGELAALDMLVPDARAEGAGSAGWSRWVAQLRRVFGAADVACHELAGMLAEPTPAPTPAGAGWFRRRGGQP
jgi:hypothetical protein